VGVTRRKKGVGPKCGREGPKRKKGDHQKKVRISKEKHGEGHRLGGSRKKKGADASGKKGRRQEKRKATKKKLKIQPTLERLPREFGEWGLKKV